MALAERVSLVKARLAEWALDGSEVVLAAARRLAEKLQTVQQRRLDDRYRSVDRTGKIWGQLGEQDWFHDTGEPQTVLVGGLLAIVDRRSQSPALPSARSSRESRSGR